MDWSWLGQMLTVGRTTSGVPILVHWSVPVLCSFVLGAGLRHILTAVAFIAGYLTILVVHELGHYRVAQRVGCRVIAVRIYPLHGACQYELPETAYDDALIAWGGVIAQLLVAAPCAAFVSLHGTTTIDWLDMLLIVLGVLSPMIAILNLLPIAPLDGRKAWRILAAARTATRDRDVAARPRTALEAMEETLRQAAKRRGA